MPAAEPDHELTRATAILLGEIQGTAGDFAKKLFPGGPAGHSEAPRDVLLDMVRRHWNEPGFRKKLLDRMAPPGPNGLPQPEGAEAYIKLYNDAVGVPGPIDQQPMTEEKALDQPDVSGFGPTQQQRLEKAAQKEEAPPMPQMPKPKSPSESLSGRSALYWRDAW
jgi:hypothetical protein